MLKLKPLLLALTLATTSAQAAQVLQSGDLKVTLTRTQPNSNNWFQAGKLTFERGGQPPLNIETARLRDALLAQISPDGRWLSVLNLHDGYAQLWDTRAAQRKFTLLAHDKLSYYARVAAFSPDSSRVVFYAFPHELSLWDTATGQRVKLLSDDRPMWYLSDADVVFSTDSRAFVVTGAGGGAQLFETKSGFLIREFDRPWSNFGGFWRGAIAATFSADGKNLAVLYAGGEARLYQPDQPQALAKATWNVGELRQFSRYWTGPLTLQGRTLSGKTPSGLGFSLTF